MLETVERLYDAYQWYFHLFELISVVIFIFEYVLRMWVCTENERYARPVVGRLRYAVSAMAIVDLLAIIPFFIPLVITVHSEKERPRRSGA